MNAYMTQSDPVRIDDKILMEAVLEQLPQKQAKRLAQAEGIQFSDVLKLSLEYRCIPRIEHLWGFPSLVRLDLNNNLIEKMEGLTCLSNLISLNLSFNSIKVIVGLDCLQKLEVLNLANNKISVIENMDMLEKLTHFNLANNLLQDLDNKFQNLFTLNLFGNPATKNEEYSYIIRAHFPKLTFLDYRIIDEASKSQALVKYQTALEEIGTEELEEQMDAASGGKPRHKLHMDAFVEHLNGPSLVKSMLKDDPEAELIPCVPGVAPLALTFEKDITEQCIQVFEIGIAEHNQRQAEVNAFFSGQTQAIKDSQQRAMKILANFELQHKERFAELQQLSESDEIKDKVNHCQAEMDKLCKELMAEEFLLVGQQEDIIKLFDHNISEMVENFIKAEPVTFAQCRELQDTYHEKVWEIAVALLENVAKGDQVEDMPDDVKILFTDRDMVMDMLTGTHDNHQMKINDREALLITRITDWKQDLLKKIEDQEIKQSRTRISDVHRYLDHLKQQLEEFQ
ncbi:dynein regulatory complex subunit 3 isoform X2 [Nelusetta ayraudi]|uniref:dynein regulatory complex subunit 3 isoform X2 n=1 Tax=Nelusetta ayraudi TaxID=303726 RepID=UPI003F6EB771